MRRAAAIILIFAVQNISAQEALSLKKAMDIAVANNHELRIVRNNVGIAELYDTPGMAGALPTVDAGVRDRESITDIDQRFSNGTTISRNDVGSNALSGDITVSYTLFNGFRIQAERDRLASMLRAGEAELVSQLQSTLADVTFRYFDVIRQQNYRKALEKSGEFSLKKKEIVEARRNSGLANDGDLFQSQIDVNTSSQQLAEQDLLIRRAQVDLAQVMSLNPDSVFALSDTFMIDRNLVKDSVFSFIKNHPDMAIAAAKIEMNEQSLIQLRSQRLPVMTVDGAYNYLRTENAAGFSLLNSSLGPSVGVTLRIPLYNGGSVRTQEKAARLQLENSKIEEDRTLQRLTAQAVKAYVAYRTALDQLDSQEESFRLAGSVLDIQLSRFRQGLSTILDLRAAQSDFEQTAAFYVNARFVAKVAETELKRLMCKLGN
ncbi:MAG: TolC family protein [Bacteroidota bacterium]